MTSIRGAITVAENTKEAILEASGTLIKSAIDSNQLSHSHIVDILFTATSDLTAVYPAAAARTLGLTSAGLMCMREMDVDGSLRSCIRLLMHVENEKKQSEMRHVYLRGAVVLRPDLARFAVAIDGPSGAGKSTAARLTAAALHIAYVDTGAMYRAIALHNLRRGIDVTDQEKVVQSLADIEMEIVHTEAGQRLLLNGEDVTEALRTQPVAEGSSVVAAYEAVREKLVALQQALAMKQPVVMDGRDIGAHVLPWAPVKIYLDAGQEERIERRMSELRQKGLNPDRNVIRQEIEIRDDRDMNRAFSPLTRSADAVYIDSGDMTTEAVAKRIIGIVKTVCPERVST